MRSAELRADRNPILDGGAQTSTGGIEEATALCDALDVLLVQEPPRDNYLHGWGMHGANARPIVCTWTLAISDAYGNPKAIPFDLLHGSSLLLIGFDVRRFADTLNIPEQSVLSIKRPMDIKERVIHTFIEKRVMVMTGYPSAWCPIRCRQ